MKRPPVVLITGSSRGVGRACAIEFARLGCLVVINGAHNKEALENTKAQILALGGQCAAIFSDVSTLNGAHDFISNAKKTFGEIDILINNAGISHIGLLTLSSVERNAFISVSTAPRATALTLIPLGASSLASAIVKALIPPFVAE